MKRIILLVFLSVPFLASAQTVEKWKIFEVTLNGPSSGNPFVDNYISAVFITTGYSDTIAGFYDGNGKYIVRFSPAIEGKWTYQTISKVKILNGKKGTFVCTPPSKENHGPVVVKDTFYFTYADGKPHYSFGTTCYAWVHQGDSLANLTLRTLSNGYFNKMRMCIFPKDYDWNKNEPLLYPFEGKPLKEWDYMRFNPAYFRNIEKRIQQLDSLGIEADLIVFHPYDRWGFQEMGMPVNEFYIRYIITRFAAYKNVWWSMANEFDFMKSLKSADWDKIIGLIATNDPYNRLRSIHNGAVWFDHTNPRLTHASIQNEDTYKAKELRLKYKKPIVYDECRYEGNTPWSWGNLTPQEMTNKFWRGITNGGFVGHGETYVTENPATWPSESKAILWWSKGGVLRGQSAERIKFAKSIIEQSPGQLSPYPLFPDWMPFSAVAYKDEYILAYLNLDQPKSAFINTLPKNTSYKADIIDTWNMTITPVENNEIKGTVLIQLPQKPGIAIRFIKK
jgi:hypothetical protein